MSSIILQRFANREIRIGCQSLTSPAKKLGDKAEQEKASHYANQVLEEYVLSSGERSGWEEHITRDGATTAIPFRAESAKRLLDIRCEFQQRTKVSRNKGGWGFKPKPTTFNKNARHRILEGGAVLDKMCGKNVVEVTLTLPGSTDEAMESLSKYSGWIMNRLTQIVRRSDAITGWFYVWEFQDRGALHLHFAIGASTLAEAMRLAKEIECKWFKLLLEIKDKNDVDLFERRYGGTWRNKPQKWQSHVQPVYKSVAAYFSKYCGKQSFDGPKAVNRFCPARWWGSSSSVKRGIEDARYRISIEVSLPNVPKAITFLRDVLSSFEPIKRYRYEFDLGQSANGTILGGGEREIFYFDDERFSSLSEIVSSLGEYCMQTWGAYANLPKKVTQTLHT